MTKRHPSLRKAASNADLYADPSPPPQQLRHAHSTLSRSHTTADSFTHRALARWEHRLNQTTDEGQARHSFAASYRNRRDDNDNDNDNNNDDDDDFRPNRHRQRLQKQSLPPVPPKILEEPPIPAPLLEFRDGQYRLPAPKPASKPAPSHPWLPAQLPPAPAPPPPP
ncbi:hypothetical protein EKO04_010838 [Ascochyta lentis]|uniref:Uncharacterized protein n=1 Tax=Ascochyta lentis TaxID=205686 RepID=A0A8H7MDY0_9PLEO|nr:hypothetical protein EKO04_010838 [Ascochyta lentis]